MNIRERLTLVRSRGEQLDPGTILFINSFKRIQGLAGRGFGVLRNPDGTPMEIPFPEPLGIATELASFDAMHIVELKVNPVRRPEHLEAIIESRSVAWRELLLVLPDVELKRFNNSNNSGAYILNAQAAAIKILNANVLSKREGEMDLRIGLPPHLQIMKGIREGTISF